MFRFFGLHAPKDFKLFDFPIFWIWSYPKVIPETLRAHDIRYWRFHLSNNIIPVYTQSNEVHNIIWISTAASGSKVDPGWDRGPKLTHLTDLRW
jgi:hypothetical protein